jgi:hypothetical protein
MEKESQCALTCHDRKSSKIPKSCRYDLVISHGNLWGGRFRVPTIEKGQISGGNGMNYSLNG